MKMKSEVTQIYCKLTAPMFMAGADKDKPELRPASIKGVMRYIWRAVQCADDLDKLRNCEGKLFGNVDVENMRQSPWKIQVITLNCNCGKDDLLPYRSGNRLPTCAIKAGSTFIVRIIGGADEHMNIVRLFVLTCMLSGFGRRSRKGMGTIAIEKIDGSGKDILSMKANMVDLLNAVSKFGANYGYDGTQDIKRVDKIIPEEYPYIENINLLYYQTDNKCLSLWRERIGYVAHLHPNPYMGSKKPHTVSRFASSLLFTTYSEPECHWLLLTQLHFTGSSAPDNRQEIRDKLLQEVSK